MHLDKLFEVTVMDLVFGVIGSSVGVITLYLFTSI